MTRKSRYLQGLAEQVAARGYAVPCVGPDADTRQPPYAYTAGLHVSHGYELAISGLPEIASDLLGLLSGALTERGTTPADGLIIDGLLHDGYSLRLRPVSNTGRFRVIGTLFPDLPSAPTIWQALWPDPGHRFPGDAGCRTTSAAQALL
ncbi:DUF4262 domain-containing protein [Streptomyces cellulosae]|uniref:DUF4262 domain-containing protein n=1 Tax=Streptomyces althioticus TaxID=83380 RepID=A0ABZ1YGL0_9ACTN|nr:DUF4262 domain-containing protein [Streptomyces cellulosae]WTB86454.1 DUF4262 domain-containing protein [Streptomyces cellulosae]WTB93281.1 DUF4262 domain-containing protein [Streptomyces cellulosae]WTC60673.1 DUF4262 domain-containing protein [Streptomyces cellulosae]